MLIKEWSVLNPTEMLEFFIFSMSPKEIKNMSNLQKIISGLSLCHVYIFSSW